MKRMLSIGTFVAAVAIAAVGTLGTFTAQAQHVVDPIRKGQPIVPPAQVDLAPQLLLYNGLPRKLYSASDAVTVELDRRLLVKRLFPHRIVRLALAGAGSYELTVQVGAADFAEPVAVQEGARLCVAIYQSRRTGQAGLAVEVFKPALGARNTDDRSRARADLKLDLQCRRLAWAMANTR